jgi:pimeloyl-ACP methyl ester carboxylesterase
MEPATATTTRAGGDYLDVDGVRTYYEVTGAGDPVVLLHGGLCTAETLDPLTQALCSQYRVYVPERFGHGRTADVDGAITYERMAQHTIALLDALDIESARLAGWSDGALVGLLVALRRPKLVHKLVLIDQYIELAGAPEAYLRFMDALTAASVPPFLAELYGALSPDGAEHFPVVFDKLHTLWTTPTGVEVADVANVASPTLLLLGDESGMRLEHAADVFGTLPDAQLAIVPGTSHGVPLEKPHLVNQLIVDFFADEQVPKMFSLADF